MFHQRPQPVTSQVDITPLDPYIEKECELTKEELMQRTAGKVDYPILQYLKLFEFDCIGKNENGSLYLL